MMATTCRRMERRVLRMGEMMQRLGIDPAALASLRQGDVYALAERNCAHCWTLEDCRAWLADPETDAPAEFCPNLPLFESCAASRSR